MRLLLDDIQTEGYDAGMAALDSHPNFEIRIFNPFANRSKRLLDGISNFSRVNRRMHNKSFTADNQVTLIGGRNIAAEYFAAREDHNFGDLDVMAIGPIVAEVSNMFDTYWNNRAAAPVEVFAKMPEDPSAALAALREKLQQAQRSVQKTPYAEAATRHAFDFLERDEGADVWAEYELVYDAPEKAQQKLAKDAASIRTPLFGSIGGAENEVIILSPYFVPRQEGINAIVELHQRGVDVTIITNSLAANNHASVHGGYSPSRKPLLENGIKIFEVRADATVSGSEIVAREGAVTTLHTKAFVVDQRDLLIGSFNFDPRSAYINTELGVIIRSPELAKRFVDAIMHDAPTEAYEVFLDEKGQIRWRGMENGREIVLDKEPQASWGRRATASFMTILPIKGRL